MLVILWRRSPGARPGWRHSRCCSSRRDWPDYWRRRKFLPSAEFNKLSSRAREEGSHEIYAFSIEPYRILEFIWPNVFGVSFGVEASWLYMLPLLDLRRFGFPSLYLGGPVLVLAITALGGRRLRRPGQGLMAAIAVLGVLAGIGSYTSPIWYARFVPRWRRCSARTTCR